MCIFSDEAEQGIALPTCFIFHTSKSSVPRFCILVLFVGGFALKVFPKHGSEVLCSVPKHKKAVKHLMEEVH